MSSKLYNKYYQKFVKEKYNELFIVEGKEKIMKTYDSIRIMFISWLCEKLENKDQQLEFEL